MTRVDLGGRTCFVTGATSGIGEETALAFARMGARVGILARSRERAERTRARIRRETGRDVEAVEGDLSSLESVRRAAREILDRFDALHVWVNNAGLICTERDVTADGFERTWATNHLGPYLLTRLVLPRIVESAPARIVVVASEAHRFAKGGLDFDDLQSERGYKTFRVYGASKLANMLFARELVHRLDGTGVAVNCVHPGAVATGLGAQNGWLARATITLLKPFFRTPAKGAETTIHVATAPELASVQGRYFVDRREVAPAATALDDDAARRLWTVSAASVGLED
jgi:NAD(P)-dependent dehydrogenase (short-subunit alcohol dehydrogenase family)